MMNFAQIGMIYKAGYNPVEEQNCRLWLNASDLTSIVQSGGLVSQWSDRSGQANHVTQATAASKPSLESGVLNGKSVVRFDGARRLTSADSITWGFLNNSQCSVYIVAKPGIVSDPNALYGLIGTSAADSSNTGRHICFDDRSGASRNNAILDTVTKSVVGSLPIQNFQNNIITPNSDFKIISVISDVTLPTAMDRSEIQINNGTVYKNNVSSVAHDSASPTHPLDVGACGNNVSRLTGDIAEILIFRGFHSTEVRNRICQYLADNWGLTL